MADYIVINGSLYHHGIKGQRWGHRRYQNEDGSYTAQGQAENDGHGRYSTTRFFDRFTIGRNKEKKETNGTFPKESKEARRVLNKKHLSPAQKRLLYGVAGGAIALGIGTVAYIAIKNKVNPITGDIAINAGDVIQRISPSDETDLHDVFYAAVNEHDKKRYEEMLPMHYMQRGASEVFKKEIGVNTDIKVAGHKACKKAFNELKKDYGRALRELGINSYDSFNQYAVMNYQPGYEDIYGRFFEMLKDRGYSGFLDINDQKYSGYAAKAPVILFNDSSVFTQKSMTLLEDDIANAQVRMIPEYFKASGEEIIKALTGNPIIVGGAGILAFKTGSEYGDKMYKKSRNSQKNESNNR